MDQYNFDDSIDEKEDKNEDFIEEICNETEHNIQEVNEDEMLTQQLISEQKILRQKNVALQAELDTIQKRVREKELEEWNKKRKIEEERLKIYQNEIEADKIFQDLQIAAKEQREIANRYSSITMSNKYIHSLP